MDLYTDVSFLLLFYDYVCLFHFFVNANFSVIQFVNRLADRKDVLRCFFMVLHPRVVALARLLLPLSQPLHSLCDLIQS